MLAPMYELLHERLDGLFRRSPVAHAVVRPNRTYEQEGARYGFPRI